MERQHARLDRITFDPDKCEGKPCIRGLRFPVSTLVGYLASGMSIEQLLGEWPELEAEDVHQALTYAAWSTTERVLEVAWLSRLRLLLDMNLPPSLCGALTKSGYAATHVRELGLQAAADEALVMLAQQRGETADLPGGWRWKEVFAVDVAPHLALPKALRQIDLAASSGAYATPVLIP
jgi:uncharacterized protein (DUF433 family)